MMVLVAKDSPATPVFAHTVPCEGSDSDGYAVARIAEGIGWLGHKRISLKSDNGPATLKLLKGSLKIARVEVDEFEQVLEE